MRNPLVKLFLLFPMVICAQNNHIRGDVNVDGVVNAADIVDIVNIIMNNSHIDIDDIYDEPNVSVDKIYGDGTTYCAFTSLIKRETNYYVAFREGKTHVSLNDYGIIRILTSSDGVKWELVQSLSVNEVDLRDPDISVMPDGRMMIICGARILSESGVFKTRTYISIEDENGHFMTPEPANLPQEVIWETCSWVWRLTWYEGEGYGVCYGDNGNITLLKTKDGKNYNFIKNLSVPGNPNECQIRFAGDKTAYMMVRRSGTDGKGLRGYMGISKPPYEDWDWKELDIYLAGHNFIIKDNSLFVVTRMTQNIGDRTVLWKGDFNGFFNMCYILPFGGLSGYCDTAYAGIVLVENQLWISYYAIDEREKPCIYLAKITL